MAEKLFKFSLQGPSIGITNNLTNKWEVMKIVCTVTVNIYCADSSAAGP
jgi:hypothetical protein